MKGIWIIWVAALLLIASSAFAAEGINSTTTVTLGSTNQDASNPKADDAEDRVLSLPGTVTVTNTGTQTITNIVATSSPSGFSTTDLNITYVTDVADPQSVPTSLNPGESRVVRFNVNVPSRLDAVTSTTLKESPFKVADLLFSGNLSNGSILLTSTNLQMQRENKLEVDDVIICVNDRCTTADDNDDVKNIRPGDKITIEIKVENRYSDSDREDVDFDDVEIEFEIDDDDFSEDDNENLGDLSADDDDSETFSFTIEDDVDDGTYDLIVRVFGRDEHGSFHGEEIEIDLEVERNDHDVEIRDAFLNPTKLACGADSTRITFTFTNIGRRDEDETVVEVLVDDLNIKERIGPFELDEDDSRTESIALSFPEDFERKTYNVVVRTLYDLNVPSDQRIIELVAEECGGDSTDTSVSTTTGTTTTNTATNTPVVQQPPVVQRRSPVQQTSTEDDTSFKQSAWYIALLAIAAVIILAVLVVLVVKALGKSSEEL